MTAVETLHAVPAPVGVGKEAPLALWCVIGCPYHLKPRAVHVKQRPYRVVPVLHTLLPYRFLDAYPDLTR